MCRQSQVRQGFFRFGTQVFVAQVAFAQALQMAHGVFLRGIVKEVRAFQINLISF